MITPKAISENNRVIYLAIWLLYMLFTLVAFPALYTSVMIASIALVMEGAWLYRWPGLFFTTLLTIPYHYILLLYSSNDPLLWHEAFNPFGIMTQLFVGGMIAMLKTAKDNLDHLNTLLEQKVEARTLELISLQHYVVQNRESTQAMLSQILLGEISESLTNMQKNSQTLKLKLIAGGEPEAVQATKLHDLIADSIDIVQNLDLIDHVIIDEQSNLADALQELAEHFRGTAEIEFNLNIAREHVHLPQNIKYQLYRIAHEAITNAVRHAKAKTIQIQFDTDRNSYQLAVTNDGAPLRELVKKGTGLKMAENRAKQLGGRIDLRNTPDGRTLFHCSVPRPLD